MMTAEPRFSDARDILAYLQTCRPRSEPGGATELRLERAGAWAMWLGYTIILTVFATALLLSRPAPLTNDAKQWLLILLMGGFVCFAVRLLTLFYLLWVGRRDWRRRAADQIIERDEAHALPLVGCPEPLLIYTKDWVKRQLKRRERSSATLMKDLGVIPAVALLYAAFNAWGSFHASFRGLHVTGLNLEALEPMFDTLFWAGLLSMIAGLLASRVQAMRYAYRIEIIEIALSLEVRSRAKASSKLPALLDPRSLRLSYHRANHGPNEA
ncbi:hypothetical protein [Luteibacter sp. SG786]|uniref:hypothetical protein n=1 Tax=Luteibacter sp. SG786 TaxID=2587130 RepID=UPI0014248D67|nr:hypothetical protein [Luteibacter sp. SG786]NII54808.1 vacuolar-type H+-ATPase subunit I/STV1 [Luteibacter sp. SG786]